MQHGIAPDAVETGVGERQLLAVAGHPRNGRVVRPCSRRGLLKICRGQIERRHSGAAPRQHDSRHAVATTEIEDAAAAHVAEPLEGGPNPRFVIEIIVVGKGQGAIGEIAGALPRLLVVKGLLAP